MNGNAAAYFVDRHIAESRGDKTVFREADGARRTLTYGALAEESARFAGALAAHGIKPGDRIAAIALDTIELPIAFWGALKAGVVPVPINTLLAPDIFRAILEDCTAPLLVVSAALREAAEAAITGNAHIKNVVVIGDAGGGDDTGGDIGGIPAITFDAFMEGAEAAATHEAAGEDIAFWLYSSGSTGTPKGVRHAHASLKATADLFGNGIMGIREDDIVHSAAKIFFAYGLGNAMSFPMAAGATTVLYSGRPTPDAVAGIFAQEKPTVFFGVPTLYAAMVTAQEKAGGAPDHALRLCCSAGEALPREVGERFQKIWGAEIVDGVGSTEMLHIFLSNAPGDVVYGTSGKPVPGYDMRLVDENGKDAETGAIGELLVRGPSAARDYWGRPEQSAATFMEGNWTRTGDKYEQRDDGRFVYCGRTDDMFKVSGIWVSPFEIEQSLTEHPAIMEAAVVGRADDDELIKPAAYVVLKDKNASVDTAELKEFVKARIGKWKYPRWVEVVDDLPKTATGKIQRFKLRGADSPKG